MYHLLTDSAGNIDHFNVQGKRPYNSREQYKHNGELEKLFPSPESFINVLRSAAFWEAAGRQ